jgi:hypothetical protein
MIKPVILFGVMLLGIPAFVSAAVYKWVDENGNVIFSDEPRPGAEEIEDVTPQTYSSPVKPREEAPESAGQTAAEPEKEPFRYGKVAITRPENDTTIRDNTGAVPVSVSIEPHLNTDEGDKVEYYVDGQKVLGPTDATSVTLANVFRGTHSISIKVVSAGGNVVKSAGPVTIHVRRTIAR